MNYRGLSTDTLNKATALTQRCYEMVGISVFDPDANQVVTSRISNCPFNLTVNGHTVYGIGNILNFTDVEEAADFSITQVTVSLNGLLNTDVRFFMNANYTDRPLKIYRVWLDDSNQIVGSPLLIFDGRIDHPIISDDGKSCTIGCTASSHWADYDRKAGRHTNFDEQQYWFGGDLGFEFSGDSTKDIKWGSN